MKKNYEKLAISLLKSIRGQRSQRRASDLAGYSYSQFSKWESGVKKIKWLEFTKICARLKNPLENTLLNTFGFRGDPSDLKAFFHWSVLGKSNSQVAKILNRPESLVRRLNRGEQEMTLADFLEIIDKIHGSLTALIAFFPKTTLPTDFKYLLRDLEEIEFTYAHPESSAILYCLKLDTYKKHVPGFIAKMTGITLESEQQYLKNFERLGLIKFDGKRYVSQRVGHLDFRLNDTQFNALVRYWLQRGANQLQPGKTVRPRSVRSYCVFPISDSGFKDIEALCISFHNQLVAIINQDNDPPEFVAAMTMMTLDAAL